MADTNTERDATQRHERLADRAVENPTVLDRLERLQQRVEQLATAQQQRGMSQQQQQGMGW